jgi:hypothetical protein
MGCIKCGKLIIGDPDYYTRQHDKKVTLGKQLGQHANFCEECGIFVKWSDSAPKPAKKAEAKEKPKAKEKSKAPAKSAKKDEAKLPDESWSRADLLGYLDKAGTKYDKKEPKAKLLELAVPGISDTAEEKAAKKSK